MNQSASAQLDCKADLERMLEASSSGWFLSPSRLDTAVSRTLHPRHELALRLLKQICFHRPLNLGVSGEASRHAQEITRAAI